MFPMFTLTHAKTLFRKTAAFALAGALFAPLTPAFAAEEPVYTSRWNNVAVGGYDATSYFNAEAPVKGLKKFSAEYNGASWRFASAENRDEFLAAPEKYAPQYGGYCAWAVAEGKTASGDPLLWTLHDGKLYLNYNKKINDRWLRDMENFIISADQNWPEVLD